MGARTIDPKYLFLLAPARDAIWEIRSIRDAPSIKSSRIIRMEGRFYRDEPRVPFGSGRMEFEGMETSKKIGRRSVATVISILRTESDDERSISSYRSDQWKIL